MVANVSPRRSRGTGSEVPQGAPHFRFPWPRPRRKNGEHARGLRSGYRHLERGGSAAARPGSSCRGRGRRLNSHYWRPTRRDYRQDWPTRRVRSDHRHLEPRSADADAARCARRSALPRPHSGSGRRACSEQLRGKRRLRVRQVGETRSNAGRTSQCWQWRHRIRRLFRRRIAEAPGSANRRTSSSCLPCHDRATGIVNASFAV
jgi:hypothetical protein